MKFKSKVWIILNLIICISAIIKAVLYIDNPTTFIACMALSLGNILACKIELIENNLTK